MTTPTNGTTSQIVEISVDLDSLKIGDLRTLEMSDGTSPKLLVDLLDRIIEGGARHLPLRSIRYIGQELKSEMEKMTEAAEKADVANLPEGVSVDVDQLTIADLELLDDKKGDRSADVIITLLERVVVGAEIEELSIKYLATINTQMQAGLQEMNDLGN